MGNGSLVRKQPCPYDTLQRPKILHGIRIDGERIEKLELWSGAGERKLANVNKTFSQLTTSQKKWLNNHRLHGHTLCHPVCVFSNVQKFI